MWTSNDPTSPNRSFVRDLNEVSVQLHGYYIRSLLNNLLDVHICQDEMIEVYEAIRQSIEADYRKRYPLGPVHQRRLAAIERDKSERDKILRRKLRKLNA